MNRYVLLGVVAVSFYANAALAQSPAGKLAPSKGWLSDINTGRLQAQKTGKPLMVVFRCDP